MKGKELLEASRKAVKADSRRRQSQAMQREILKMLKVVSVEVVKTREQIKKASRWIPVTERLPDIPDGWAEHPDPVLYMMKSTGMIYAGYYGENGTYRDKYFRQYADGHEGVDADDVLCWMWQHDLPEPPKEAE